MQLLILLVSLGLIVTPFYPDTLPPPEQIARGVFQCGSTHDRVPVERKTGNKFQSSVPGDPAGLHETGRISPSLADGRVAARAAPSSAVVVGAARAVPLPVDAHM